MSEKIDINNFSPPEGYNPIAKIRGALFHWVSVPFNGEPIWIKLTCLNAIQIKSCGDISCLYLPKNKKKEEKEPNILEMIKIKNAQEALCKASMICPSFDKIIGMISDENFLISEKKKALEKINKEINSAKLEPKQKKELQKKADQIEFYLGFLLPDDTMSFITMWALGIKITDIQKLNRKLLLDAAILAKNGGDNPTDHISGVFTDFHKEDINKHAWIIYNEYQAEKERERQLMKRGKR